MTKESDQTEAHVRAVERFFTLVDRTKTCHRWLGQINSDGYGRFYYLGRMVFVHRFVHELVYGEISDPTIKVLHRCSLKSCVNPGHTYRDTQQKRREPTTVAPADADEIRHLFRQGLEVGESRWPLCRQLGEIWNLTPKRIWDLTRRIQVDPAAQAARDDQLELPLFQVVVSNAAPQPLYRRLAQERYAAISDLRMKKK